MRKWVLIMLGIAAVVTVAGVVVARRECLIVIDEIDIVLDDDIV